MSDKTMKLDDLVTKPLYSTYETFSYETKVYELALGIRVGIATNIFLFSTLTLTQVDFLKVLALHYGSYSQNSYYRNQKVFQNLFHIALCYTKKVLELTI